MGYIVYVKSTGGRFEKWTGKVHRDRVGAINEMNAGIQKYKEYSKKSYMKESVTGDVWVVRKVPTIKSNRYTYNLNKLLR